MIWFLVTATAKSLTVMVKLSGNFSMTSRLIIYVRKFHWYLMCEYLSKITDPVSCSIQKDTSMSLPNSIMATWMAAFTSFTS